MHVRPVLRVLGLMLLLQPPSSSAQGAEHVLRGTVRDEAGRGIPGVAVRMCDDEGPEDVARGLTDAEGRYELRVPAPGEYTLRCELMGFATEATRREVPAEDAVTVVDDVVLSAVRVRLVICDLRTQVPLVRRDSQASTQVSEELFRHLPGQ